MLIAKLKLESNIIEYLLYMYQIEDIIRSFQMDIEAIDRLIVSKYEQKDSVKDEIKAWYSSLIYQMKEEEIERKGHLSSLKNIINELQEVHTRLLTTVQEKKYLNLYENTRPILRELLLKSKGENLVNEIDISIHGLYGLLMLKLKGKEIAKETQLGMQKISSLLAHLAYRYKEFDISNIQILKEQNN